MDRSSIFNNSKTRDDKAYLRYLVESNLKIVKGCATNLNSTKNIADELGTKIANQGDQIKGLTKNVDLLNNYTKEGEKNLNLIESSSKSYLYFCCKQCTRSNSIDEEINLSPSASKENSKIITTPTTTKLPITVQPKLTKLRNQSIDYGNRQEIEQAIDIYLEDCQESIEIIKKQAIEQGDELNKQVKDLNKINTKVENNTVKFKSLTSKTRKLISKNQFFSFF